MFYPNLSASYLGKEFGSYLTNGVQFLSIFNQFLQIYFGVQFCPQRNITLKIAAIEQRSNFKQAGLDNDYLGVELGADISADVNLDDFMVFDNDATRATTFFQDLLFKHFISVS